MNSRRVVIAVWVVALFWTVAVPGLMLTATALFSATTGANPQQFSGVTFIPNVAPVPVTRLVDSGVHLEWAGVNLSNGSSAQYEVVRTGSDDSVHTVCTGVSAPVRQLVTDSCIDTGIQADVTYTYSEKPIVQQNGLVTWSRPASNPSLPILAPKLRFGGLGAVSTSTSPGVVAVQYPLSATTNDVAILVVRHSRKTAIAAPSGWTPLVELASNGPQSFLLIAWRVVGTETSVNVDLQGTPQGSAAWVATYKRTAGNSSTPVLATATVRAENAPASSTFTQTSTMTTSVNNAAVISIASVLATNSLTLQNPNGYSLKTSTTATSGGNGFAMGIADQIAVKNAVSVQPPTWSQSGIAALWQVATIAFS